MSKEHSNRLALIEFDMGWSFWLTAESVPFSLGRHPSNSMCSTSNYVSRHHCSLDYRDGRLVIADNGSANGTVVNDLHVKNAHVPVTERTCVLLSDMLLWITPCDAEGKLLDSNAQKQHDTDITVSPGEQIEHGVCLVDICNSVEMNIQRVNHATHLLRSVILAHDQSKVLLLKNLGDGYLIVYQHTESALDCAARLLKWQRKAASKKDTAGKIDIRVAMDSGLTYRAHCHDRVGLSICRVSRFEKTQRRDIELPGANIDELKPRNRCLFSQSVLDHMPTIDYHDIGKRRLKGFPSQMYGIYQLPTAS